MSRSFDKTKAWWQRFCHCLRHLHRSEHCYESGKGLTYLGCECGRVFYGERPWFFQRREGEQQ